MKSFCILLLLVATGLGCSHEVATAHRADGIQEVAQDGSIAQDSDAPTDVPAAVEKLRNYVEQLNTAIAGGSLKSTYPPLAEADSVVESMMVIAPDSGVPKCYWDRLNAALHGT